MFNPFSDNNKIFLLDSSYFFGTQQIPETSNKKIFYTTPEILAEIQDPINKLRLDSLISMETLIITSGSEVKKKEFFFKMRKLSNLSRLSEADQSLLILALTLKEKFNDKTIVVVTDDYEIQNVSRILEINYQSIRMKGIHSTRIYTLRCKNCNFKINKNDIECENCGNQSFYHKKK